MTRKILAIAYIGIAFGVMAGGRCFAAQAVDTAGLPVITQDVSVVQAVDIALKNNPSIAARRALVSAAAARVGMAKAMTRPQVSTSTFGTVSNMAMVVPGADNVEPRNFSLTPDKPRLNQNVMAMYPIYTGGSLKLRVTGAQAQEQASASDVATTELDTALAVKSAYYQALLAQGYVDAYQKRVDEAQERLKLAEVAYAEGRIARYDLLRSQTDLAEAQQQLNNSQRDVQMALIDLKSMMGVSQTSQLTLSQELTVQSAPALLDELQACALKQRPELAAVRARIRSSEANVGVAKSAYKPQVYATAMADLSVMKNDGMSGSTDTGYLVGVTAALPVFDGGLRKSSVNEAQSMLEQMRAEERDTTLMVTKSVAIAYTQFETAAKNIGLAQAAVTQAEEDYRVIRMRYEAGKATNVEVLDALASLTRARTMYTEALYEQNIAREQLTRATGQR